MTQTPHGSQPDDSARIKSEQSGMLLGLPPLLLWGVASVLMRVEGRCQSHTGSIFLAFLATLLWVGEVAWGLLLLFVRQKRAFAGGLLCILLLSLLLGFIIAYLTVLVTLCLHLIF